MSTGSQDMRGYTERESLLIHLGWATSWLKKVSKDLKSVRVLIQSCRDTLEDRSVSPDAKCSAATMMLNGFITSYMTKYDEDTNGNSDIDRLARTCEGLENISENKARVEVKPSIDVTTDTEVSNFDQQMFDQYIRSLVTDIEHLNEIVHKYAGGCLAQVHMKIVDVYGRPVNISGLDVVKSLTSALEDAKKKEKPDKTLGEPAPAEVTPLESPAAEPAQPETPSPEEVPNGVQN